MQPGSRKAQKIYRYITLLHFQ